MVEKRKVRCTHGKTWGQIKRQYLPRPTCFPWKRYFGGKKADDRRNQRRSLNQLPTTVSSPLSNSISFQKTSRQLIDALSDDKLTHFPETFRTLSSITTGDHRVLLNKHETRTREETRRSSSATIEERENVVPDRVKTITGTAIRLSSTGTKSRGYGNRVDEETIFPPSSKAASYRVDRGDRALESIPCSRDGERVY